jgi:hypothetical protein
MFFGLIAKKNIWNCILFDFGNKLLNQFSKAPSFTQQMIASISA